MDETPDTEIGDYMPLAVDNVPQNLEVRNVGDQKKNIDNNDDNLSWDHVTKKATQKLLTASIICLVFMVIETVAGILSNSLALLNDASHLLSDLCSFLISLFALWVSSLQGNSNMSFGYHRAEIIGALLSVLLIWVVTAILVYEACSRLLNPPPVKGSIMFWTALVGAIANIVMTQTLHTHNHGMNTGKHECTQSSKGLDVSVSSKCHAVSMNLRAAYIHALGDLLQNIGVLIASLLLWIKPAWRIADPICTLVFSVFVVCTTVSIIKESVNVLMEGSPTGIDIKSLHQDLLNIEGVFDVHDLHVWSLSIGKPALACHIVTLDQSMACKALEYATTICQIHYGILHTTIQTDFSFDRTCCDTVAHKRCGVT